MRDRFTLTGESGRHLPKSLIFIVMWAGILALFIFGTGRFSGYTQAKQRESLEAAVSNDIAQCYAVEGFYPPDVQYLKDHYGLYYDENHFFIDYRTIGSNMYPDVTVIERK